MTRQEAIHEFNYTIVGIPAVIRVLSWEPFVPGHVSGPPEKCFPSEGGYGELEICDSKGRPAPWLEAKLSRLAREALEEQAFMEMEQGVYNED